MHAAFGSRQKVAVLKATSCMPPRLARSQNLGAGRALPVWQ
jgi:hypothetical protein